MRSTESDCLLCKSSKATKTNSHIVPKFMTKSLLGTGSVRHAFTLSSSKADKAPLISQDSPKSSYLFCPDCESFFSVLETEASKNFYNGIWEMRDSNRFKTHQSSGRIIYRTLEELNPKVFALFLYSIVWRCSISGIPLFQYLNLDVKDQESLRVTLSKFRSLSLNEIIARLSEDESDFIRSEYALFTSDGFKDETRNVLFIPPGNRNPYCLILNQFQLL